MASSIDNMSSRTPQGSVGVTSVISTLHTSSTSSSSSDNLSLACLPPTSSGAGGDVDDKKDQLCSRSIHFPGTQPHCHVCCPQVLKRARAGERGSLLDEVDRLEDPCVKTCPNRDARTIRYEIAVRDLVAYDSVRNPSHGGGQAFEACSSFFHSSKAPPHCESCCEGNMYRTWAGNRGWVMTKHYEVSKPCHPACPNHDDRAIRSKLLGRELAAYEDS
jgi:hypothetical protein